MKRSLKLILGAAICAAVYTAAQLPEKRRPGLARLEGWRYAHRGLHDLGRGIPENTLPAFKSAFNSGFGAELDVHLTKDGQLVVIHDSVLKRLCGVDSVVEDMSYDAIKGLGILGTGCHAPLFEEVLDFCGGVAPLIIELKAYKGNHDRLCESVAAMLDSYKGDYCIESFDPRVVKWYHDNRPQVIRGQLSANFMKRGEGAGLNLVERFALSNLQTNFLTRPDFIAYKYADSNSLPVALSCGLFGGKEVNWTIDKKCDLEEAEKRGAIAIFERFIP